VHTIGAAANQYQFAALVTPITLEANRTYHVASTEGGSDTLALHNGTLLSTTAAATPLGAVVGNPNRFDGMWLNFAHHSYGPLNFQYRVP
jgi:hypothetical protein